MIKVPLSFFPGHITLDMAGQGLWELALPSADRSDHLSSVQGKAHGVTDAQLTLAV